MGDRFFKAVTGPATVTLKGPLKDMFEATLRKAYPDIVKTFETTLTRIKDDAEKEWPVRRRKSQRSVDQFEIRLGLRSNGLVVQLDNDAPYAGGILSGRLRPSLNESGSKSEVPPGRLVWWHLLYRPAVRAADAVAKALAEELLAEMRKEDK
jgi:hypothetical protein